MLAATIYNNSQGFGYVSDTKSAIRTRKVSIRLGNNVIQPGDRTDLNCFFCRPLEYLGMRRKNELIFYIGKHEDLYTQKHFFQSILWLSDKRFFMHYTAQSGRDYNFVNCTWK